jgi:hemerythrin-like domain-containing protein
MARRRLDMSRIMRRLEADHRNTAHLLDLLEREVDAFERGERPTEYELLRSILDYLLDYPDLGHHPMEDVVFRVLCRRAPQLSERFEVLAGQHRELSALTQGFSETVDSVLADFAVPRAELVDRGRRFVRRYRDHMRLEDEEFFPEAKKHLDFADWGTIDAEFDAPNDPLFGASAQARFERLRAEIDELAAETV